MKFFTLSALSLALGYAVFQKAGVGMEDWNVVILAIAVIACIYFAWPRRAKIRPLDRLSSISLIAVLLIVAIQLIPLPVGVLRVISPARFQAVTALNPIIRHAASFAALSEVPAETTQYLLTMTCYVLVFLIIRDVALRSDGHPWMTVWPLLGIGALEAGLGIFQAYGGDVAGFATGTYVNRDHYAGLMEMILPFAALYPLAVLQRDDEDAHFESRAVPAIKACLLWAVAAVMLVAIILSLSRMAFLATLAALLVGGSIALSFRGWRVDYSVRMSFWRRWFPTAVVAAIIGLGFVFLPTDPLVARFADLAKTDDISADTRSLIWRDTTQLIKAYPVLGCGMGGYESCFLKYKTVAPMNTVDYAHNDYLQVLAELGILGFCAGLVFVIRLFQGTARATVYAQSVDERYLTVACLAAMTAILLHSFVDFNMYVPANGLVFAWIAGIAGVHLRRRSKVRDTEAGVPE